MPDYSAFPVTDGVTTFLAPPDDYDVDFDNPQRQYDLALYLIVGIGNFLTALFMYQRLYVKIVIAKGLQIEDGFLVLSWDKGSVAIGARGVHAWEQPIERYVLFRKSVYVGGAVFMPCASFAKAALLIFYLRLSPQTWFRYAVWATMGLIAGYTPAIFLALLFACKPVHSSWSPDVHGECIDTTALFIATCVVNSLTDVILFLLPIPTVLGLRMPLPQKLGVIALFSVGLVTIVTSVIRAAILPQMSGPDQSWVTAQASVWSQLECNLIVICGTVPTLKKFLRHVAPKILGSSSGGGSKSGNTPAPTPSLVPSHPRNRRNPYAQFGGNETDFEMTRWEGDDASSGKETPATVVVSSNRPPHSDDGGSEKAIMVTREVSVKQH